MLSGIFLDQADLFGVLSKIHALNLVLISVRRKDVMREGHHLCRNE